MRQRDEQKVRIICEKAIEIVVKEGFDGLSMHKLAKSANVSPATIYIYFKDRDDLIVSVCVREFNKMSEATLQNFSPDLHFDEGLKIQWMNRAKYCLENPDSMHLLEQAKYSPYIEEVHKNADNTFRTIMQEFVQNAISRNELIELPMEVYWSVAFSPLYTLVKFHMTAKSFCGKRKFLLDETVLNQTIQLVLKALKP